MHIEGGGEFSTEKHVCKLEQSAEGTDSSLRGQPSHPFKALTVSVDTVLRCESPRPPFFFCRTLLTINMGIYSSKVLF